MIRMTLAATTLIAAAAVAHAQTPNPDPAQQPARSFEDVQALLLSGDTVHVFDDKGTGTKGRLSSIRDGVLNLTFDSTRRTVPFDTIVQIDRTRRDPVKDGVLNTPIPDCLLNGITRQTVMTLAKEAGIKVVERHIQLDELMAADEVFLTGTAAELTPVGKINQQIYTVGPITRQLHKLYEDAVNA